MKLVREYVACMDELSQIYSISEQKIEYLRKLKVDCEALVTEASNYKNEILESERRDMVDRIDWAIKTLRSNHERIPSILGDLKSSLDVVRDPKKAEFIAFL